MTRRGMEKEEEKRERRERRRGGYEQLEFALHLILGPNCGKNFSNTKFT
jgi:hypothetical protein